MSDANSDVASNSGAQDEVVAVEEVEVAVGAGSGTMSVEEALQEVLKVSVKRGEAKRGETSEAKGGREEGVGGGDGGKEGMERGGK